MERNWRLKQTNFVSDVGIMENVKRKMLKIGFTFGDRMVN